MEFLHSRVYAKSGDVVVMEISSQANVFLVDDSNFSSYRNGQGFRYFGTLQRHSPVRLPVPHTGYWNVVVDMGGYAGSVRASNPVIVKGR